MTEERIDEFHRELRANGRADLEEVDLTEVYCLGSSGRRNSTVLKGFHVPPILLDTRPARATGSRKKEVGS